MVIPRFLELSWPSMHCAQIGHYLSKGRLEPTLEKGRRWGCSDAAAGLLSGHKGTGTQGACMPGAPLRN